MKKVWIAMPKYTRKVGERGQVTIPKELRDSHGIGSGDDVVFVELNDEIRLKQPTDENRLAEGYRKRAERSRQLVEEMEVGSSEATQHLGDSPEWSEWHIHCRDVQVRRGDIVIVALNPIKGTEQRGRIRLCVVVQNDVGNQYSPTTIVAPFTTQYDPDEIYPFEVEVRSSDTPLDRDSVADLSQIRVVDIETRIRETIGSVPDETMVAIDSAIKDSLGL
jgi:mRNA interferase MazF